MPWYLRTATFISPGSMSLIHYQVWDYRAVQYNSDTHNARTLNPENPYLHPQNKSI